MPSHVVFTPFPIAPEAARWGNSLFGIGRLKPGVTVDQARQTLGWVRRQTI
ncbi:MAG TPA: hypothetical protein VH458_18320 [Vicinamibacterales bacterium]|jgi:hypothetical protein